MICFLFSREVLRKNISKSFFSCVEGCFCEEGFIEHEGNGCQNENSDLWTDEDRTIKFWTDGKATMMKVIVSQKQSALAL